MIYIEHRKNKISELAQVSVNHGVEIDLRSDVSKAGEIHLSHDAWSLGDSFDLWLNEFSKLKILGPIYLNTKEDGLEGRTLELLKKYNISNYLFLDTAWPTLIKNVNIGMGSKFFLRLSKYEDLENSMKFKNKVEWIWVDCFNLEALDVNLIQKAKKDFKLCLVSPELQGGTEGDFSRFVSIAKEMNAICTKKPKAWQALI